MEQNTNRLDELLSSLRKELETSKKTRFTTIVLGIILVLVVFFIFMALTKTVKKNITPGSLAEVAAFATRQVVKDGRPLMEQAFKTNIPLFLKSLRRSLVNDLVPLLRKQIEHELRKAIDKTYLSSSQAFNVAVGEVLKKVKPEGEKAGDPAFIASLITAEFEKEKNRRYSEKPEETLGYQYQESKKMLMELNRKLNLMLTSEPKTREEALETRFLKAWVSLITRGEIKEEVTAREAVHEAKKEEPAGKKEPKKK